VYGCCVFVLVSTIGAFKIKTGNLIEDMPRILAFIKIFFFENEFNGVMPLEIMVDTQRKKSNEIIHLEKMDEFQTTIEEIRKFKPISILNLVKYSKCLL
jgi:hypothetical protein